VDLQGAKVHGPLTLLACSFRHFSSYYHREIERVDRWDVALVLAGSLGDYVEAH
jgi:hypothetical protein